VERDEGKKEKKMSLGHDKKPNFEMPNFFWLFGFFPFWPFLAFLAFWLFGFLAFWPFHPQSEIQSENLISLKDSQEISF
jgi:hypothetical protein